MHRLAEKRRRWDEWERNEIYGDHHVPKQRTENSYRASLDTRLLVSRGKNNVQVKGKVGAIGFCHFCGSKGVIVEKFPRRGYGKYGTAF